MPLIQTFISKAKALASEVNTNFANLLIIHVRNEDYTALTNGIKLTFTTAFPFKPGTLQVSRNGLRMRPAASGTGTFTENLDLNGNGISFTINDGAPIANTPLVGDYQRANV